MKSGWLHSADGSVVQELQQEGLLRKDGEKVGKCAARAATAQHRGALKNVMEAIAVEKTVICHSFVFTWLPVHARQRKTQLIACRHSYLSSPY
eukprot:1159346-Pelagomonas_calceolata.AAC.4